jgi:hypothetical protein
MIDVITRSTALNHVGEIDISFSEPLAADAYTIKGYWSFATGRINSASRPWYPVTRRFLSVASRSAA